MRIMNLSPTALIRTCCVITVTAIAALTVAACASTQHPSKSRAPDACVESVSPTGHVEQDYEALVRTCARSFKPISPTFIGSQNDQVKSAHVEFVTNAPQTCIRVFGAGDVSVDELDLLIRDQQGRAIVKDSTRGRLTIAPSAASLCLPQPGQYSVDLAVTRGSGRIIAGVWAESKDRSP